MAMGCRQQPGPGCWVAQVHEAEVERLWGAGFTGLIQPHGVVQEISGAFLFQPAHQTVEKGGRWPTAGPRVGCTQKTWMSRLLPGRWRPGYGVTGCDLSCAMHAEEQVDAVGTAHLPSPDPAWKPSTDLTLWGAV